VRPAPRAVLAAVALLVVGAVAVLTAPTDEGVHGPIAVRGSVGHAVTGRLATITVDRVRVAHRIRLPDGARFDQPAPVLGTNGIWIVVDAEVTVHVAARSYSAVELRYGAEHFRVAPALPGESLIDTPYRPGVPLSGSFVFEVPKRLAGRTVELWLTPDIETHDDTVPVIPLQVSAEVSDRVTVDAPAVGASG
jgi:hypothetical protein